MRRQECLASCRRPAIDGDLNQCVFDLVDGNAARTRRIRINAKLLKAAQSCEDAKRQDTSRLLAPIHSVRIQLDANVAQLAQGVVPPALPDLEPMSAKGE